MKSYDSIEFEIDGQDITIEFNQPHWSDNPANLYEYVGQVQVTEDGRPIRYKNDLID